MEIFATEKNNLYYFLEKQKSIDFLFYLPSKPTEQREIRSFSNHYKFSVQ